MYFDCHFHCECTLTNGSSFHLRFFLFLFNCWWLTSFIFFLSFRSIQVCNCINILTNWRFKINNSITNFTNESLKLQFQFLISTATGWTLLCSWTKREEKNLLKVKCCTIYTRSIYLDLPHSSTYQWYPAIYQAGYFCITFNSFLFIND